MMIYVGWLVGLSSNAYNDAAIMHNLHAIFIYRFMPLIYHRFNT